MSSPWILLPSPAWLCWDLVGAEAGGVARTVPTGHIGGAGRTGMTGAVHRGAAWMLRDPWEKQESWLSECRSCKMGTRLGRGHCRAKVEGRASRPRLSCALRGEASTHQVPGPPPSLVTATTDVSQHRPGPRGPRLESPYPGHDQTRGRLRKDGAEGHERGGCLSRMWALDNRNGYTRRWTRAVKRACKSPSLRQAPRSWGPGPTEPDPWTSESAGALMSMAMWK